jgi:hypothetical protein
LIKPKLSLNSKRLESNSPGFPGAAGFKPLDPAFALHFLADQLARAANGFRLLAGLFLGGLFVKLAPLHFAERAFALHLFLKSAERLLDIVVADYDLNQGNTLLLKPKRRPPGRFRLAATFS